MSSHTSRATQLGFELGQQGWIVSGDKKLREVRNDFAIQSLSAHGLHQSQATISSFKAGYSQGWRHSEKKAAEGILR